MQHYSSEDLITKLGNTIDIKENGIGVKDKNDLKNSAIDELVRTAVFADAETKKLASYLIWESGIDLGIISASIHDLYMAAGRGEYANRTVPAINIRGLTYDVARAIFKSAILNRVGAFIFEIARSEIGYTNQRPEEYTTVVLAAAIREGFTGPVFIQGDHFQVNPNKYKSNPEQELSEVKILIKEAIEAGFFNIDIDTSTLVDMEKQGIKEQQYLNYKLSAELTAYIRSLEPEGITVSVGGEIGEVGGKNSNVHELETYLDNYCNDLNDIGQNCIGLSKISVQTGTTHGGVVLADGSIAQVSIDFDTLEDLSRVSKEKYGLGGAVQHGASTLPDDAFHHFPETGTCEVHLATGFQNMIYDHPAMPEELKEKVYRYLFENCADERKEGQSDSQFLYKTRKKGFGPFKEEWWGLPEDAKSKIFQSLEDKFDFLFKKLNVTNTVDLVKNYVNEKVVHKPKPDNLI